jgi:hypothetical protein
MLVVLQTGSLDLFGFFLKPKQKLLFGKRRCPSTKAVTIKFLDDLSQADILRLTQ